MEYMVICVRNNHPHPYPFADKGEALEFAKGQIKEGWIYTSLWQIMGDYFNPLDMEAVERNLYATGVWL